LKLERPTNPLIERGKKSSAGDPVFDQGKLEIGFSVKSKVNPKREIRKLFRQKTAVEALGDIYQGCSIFGITKGQFSLIDLIAAVLEQTGPASIFLSTWTAANADIHEAFVLMDSGKITDARFLVDLTFQRRQPDFAKRLRDLFGPDSVRVTRNHAKFCLIQNSEWNIVLKTSMNLNMNPRLEDFCLEDDPALTEFLNDLGDEIFKKQASSEIEDRPAENKKRFASL